MINSMKRFNKICVYLILLNFCSNYFSASCISSRSTFKNEQNIDETEGEFYQCNDGINGTCIGEKLKCDGTRIRHRCNGCDKWAMMCDAPSVKIGKERSSGDYCTTLSPSPHKTTTFYNYNGDGDANSKCYAADRLIREFSHFSQIITCSPNYMRSVFQGVWWPSIDEYYTNNRRLENADYYGILVDKVSRNYCREEIRNQKIFNVTGWGRAVSSAGDSSGKMLSFTDFQPYEYITFDKLRAGSETGEARRKMPINSQDKDSLLSIDYHMHCHALHDFNNLSHHPFVEISAV
ncbi:uncharacterized protein LOC135846527 isoform X2 [Planococcus citri]|uniref:uncharacterized protein LOC135846527 isoform X2 n=1 Tax=Planococcus citri TaxID=170843 RepID=UPI0031F89831